MFLRALVVLGIAALPTAAATFGTVMAHPQPIADLAVDPTRPFLYVLNATPVQELVEFYEISNRNAPSLRRRVNVGDAPLALAVAATGAHQ
jgi:hypothetical protein